jgi:GDPmannose 4,6-dehydratase
MRRALVIGILGQDGTYLTEHLLEQGYEVYGLVRKAWHLSPQAVEWGLNKSYDKRVTFLYGDVRDELSIRNAIQKSWPSEIYNLAGQVFVPLSWQAPAETFDVNTGGLARILKVVEQVKKDAKVYQASTSEMFGNHEGACTEETQMNPTSPYGISKLAAHRLVQLYRDRGLYVVAGILFNHESPRRGNEMVTRKIAKAVAAWATGDEEPLSLGNMDSRRDWGFAGEYVKAMYLMLQQDVAQDYVVGTGESHSVKEFLGEAVGVAGLSREFVEDHLKIDQRLTRAQEIYDMRADTGKIERVLGWKPRMKFAELVAVMVQAELKKLWSLQEVG